MIYQTDEYKRATKLIWYTLIGLLIFCVITAGHNKAAKDVAEIRLENCTKQVKILKANLPDIDDKSKPLIVSQKMALERKNARIETVGQAKLIAAEYEARIRQLKGDIKIAEARAAKKNSEGGALIVQKNWWWKNVDGNIVASGRLVNKSAFTVTEVKLQLLIRDNDKAVTNSAYRTYKDISMAPGEALEFWIRAEKYQKFYKWADIIIVHTVYEHRS